MQATQSSTKRLPFYCLGNKFDSGSKTWFWDQVVRSIACNSIFVLSECIACCPLHLTSFLISPFHLIFLPRLNFQVIFSQEIFSGDFYPKKKFQLIFLPIQNFHPIFLDRKKPSFPSFKFNPNVPAAYLSSFSSPKNGNFLALHFTFLMQEY